MKHHRQIILSVFLFFTLPDGVLASERGQSIMFEDNPGYQTKTPISSVNDTDETCKRLADEIERLKGKPQKRYTAKQRFDAECKHRFSDE